MAALVNACIDVLHTTSRATHHPVALAAESAPINADRTRMGQIIDNLLATAIKYTPNGGKAEFDAHSEQQDAVLMICDHGIGISSELSPRLFEVFVQGDASLTDRKVA